VAHSQVPNAGQKYASARKSGLITGKKLLDLRNAACVSRKRAKGAPIAEDSATVAARIEAANRAHQSSSRWY